MNGKNLDELIPSSFTNSIKIIKELVKLEFLLGSLELVKEGNLTIKQEKLFDNIYDQRKLMTKMKKKSKKNNDN